MKLGLPDKIQDAHFNFREMICKYKRITNSAWNIFILNLYLSEIQIQLGILNFYLLNL